MTWLVLLIVAPACRGAAAETGATTVVADDDPAIVLLDKLEARGQRLRSYQARVIYVREQGLLGDTQTRLGSIDYHAGPPARFAVAFTHLVADGVRREQPRRYVFDGTWLAEQITDEKRFIRRQIVAPGESYDPLKLGEGPFPFPIGQQRDEVLHRFRAGVIAPGEDDPTGTTHLQLTPRTNPDTGKPTSDFTTVDIWYDDQTLLPVKVVTYEQEADNTTTVTLDKARIDQISDEQVKTMFDTTPPKLGTGWQVEIKPLERESSAP